MLALLVWTAFAPTKVRPIHNYRTETPDQIEWPEYQQLVSLQVEEKNGERVARFRFAAPVTAPYVGRVIVGLMETPDGRPTELAVGCLGAVAVVFGDHRVASGEAGIFRGSERLFGEDKTPISIRISEGSIEVRTRRTQARPWRYGFAMTTPTGVSPEEIGSLNQVAETLAVSPQSGEAIRAPFLADTPLKY